MMENKKITHIDWKAIEDKLGNFLTEDQVCFLLEISNDVLRDYYNRRILKTEFDFVNRKQGFNIIDVKYFAEKYLGIKDGSYIHDKEQKKDEEQKKDDFFISICSSITQRIADAKEIAEKNGNECGLSYLVGCFDLTTNSIRNYIQTHQEEYKEDNSKTDSLSRKEANNVYK